MVSSVSSNDPRQNAQQAQEIQRQKQQQARNIQKNQPPSNLNTQPKTTQEQDQVRAEKQNSQQAKGASLDVRA